MNTYRFKHSKIIFPMYNKFIVKPKNIMSNLFLGKSINQKINSKHNISYNRFVSQ